MLDVSAVLLDRVMEVEREHREAVEEERQNRDAAEEIVKSLTDQLHESRGELYFFVVSAVSSLAFQQVPQPNTIVATDQNENISVVIDERVNEVCSLSTTIDTLKSDVESRAAEIEELRVTVASQADEQQHAHDNAEQFRCVSY